MKLTRETMGKIGWRLYKYGIRVSAISIGLGLILYFTTQNSQWLGFLWGGFAILFTVGAITLPVLLFDLDKHKTKEK